MLSRPWQQPGQLRAATAAAVGAGWTLFQLYTGFFGELSAIPQRAIHLGFALTLLFLVRPSGKRWENKSHGWLGPVIDAVLIAAGIVTTVYLAYDHVGIAERLGRMQSWEFWFGLVLILVLLEGTRRAVGWPLPLIAVGFLLYGFYGDFIPGDLGHRAYSLERVIGQVYLMTEGIFGVALGVSAGFLFLFVAFAANPALLLIGSPGEVAMALITAVLGILALAAGAQGVISRPLGVLERLFMITGAVLLIIPGLETALVGVLFIALVLANHYLRSSGKRSNPSGVVAGKG